ncbi:MAG: nicotinate (nicotinamide) nucleotide adenylyltransferase [Candidatus Omnitrophica bacterium]|nr:nicotinate (nicotinamide) nucleotide adenylyltransferase [Candidatus Omnitrophota bacterium]
MRVGIFGGSFNPVHNGHLKLAREALSELNLTQVVFVPSFVTPLKEKETLLPAFLRVKLLRAALRPYRGFFKLSLYEIKKEGVSFTVDTLRYFKKVYGDKAVLFFLAGSDVLKGLSRWKSLNEVSKLCRFVVFTRQRRLTAKAPIPILTVPLRALPVSATEIRRRLKKGLSLKGFVPEEITPVLQDWFDRLTIKGGLSHRVR